MKVQLDYGRAGLSVDLPDRNVDVIAPLDLPGLPDEAAAVRAALRLPVSSAPLRDLARADDDVVIVVNDGTRPTPSTRLLPLLLAELGHVPRERITILVATGTHRANTPAELDEMLGPDVAHQYRVINHDARNPAMLRYLGESTLGHPIWLNRHYMDARVKILTGFVEPHFFAGFSGGPKPVMPGLAGLETVLWNHGPAMIADPRATFGVLEGNPIHEEQREIALLTGPTFSLNVTLNAQHQLTGVWGGEMDAVHAEAVAFVRRTAVQSIAHAYDVVVTTNSGYPLDQNLYQAVKGMSAAARAVRPGGAIVLAAECSDGLPAHGTYAEMLRNATTIGDLLARIEAAPRPLADGWQAQIQAQVQSMSAVYLFSTLPDDTVRGAHLTPTHDIGATVRALMADRGPEASVLVLPQGPQTIVMRDAVVVPKA
jgi:nickel-dependent lactate racemase